jgi:hypothetical protein
MLVGCMYNCSCKQQQLHNCCVAAAGCKVQGNAPIMSRCVNSCSCTQQQLHDCYMATLRCKLQGSLAVLFNRVNSCSCTQQQLHNWCVALQGCKVEGSDAILCCCVHICPWHQQQQLLQGYCVASFSIEQSSGDSAVHRLFCCCCCCPCACGLQLPSWCIIVHGLQRKCFASSVEIACTHAAEKSKQAAEVVLSGDKTFACQ